MSKEIATQIVINSSAEKVWKVLTNFSDFPEWNPFIQSISGDLKVGGRLSIKIQLPARKPMGFTPKVLVLSENSELRWLGSGPIKGLFDGEHYFQIIPIDEGSVKFVHGEIFSGLLIPLMPKLLRETQKGFEQMNLSIKGQCEKT